MSVCTLESDGWCERHKDHHLGRLRELALMDDALGESYRSLWDEQIPVNGKGAVRVRRRDCVFLGEIAEHGTACGQQHVYRCGLHGLCTKSPCRNKEVPCCMGGHEKSCRDYREPVSRDFFGRVAVINLERRPDRLESFQKELADKGWPFKMPERFDAVDGNRVPCPPGWKQGGGSFGCKQSHTRVLELALMDRIDSILVLEDDLVLCDDFPARIDAFLREVPDDWEGLWLGGQHMTPGKFVKPGIVQCKNSQRTHAYAARGRFLRALYAHWCRPATDVHIDWIVGEVQQKHAVYAPDPFLFGQSRTMSDICGRVNPTKFWTPPKGDEPLYVVKCSKDAIKALRELGLHTGYQRDPQSDIDVGLVEVFKQDKHRELALKKWIKDLMWEIVSEPTLSLGIWHPEATAELARKCWGGPVEELTAGSVEEAICMWKEMTLASGLP